LAAKLELKKLKYEILLNLIIEGEKAERMMDLEYLNQQLLAKFFSTLKLKPNDTCICGSGLNFINCCKPSLVKTN
jgi:uncharacterized protein YchJ